MAVRVVIAEDEAIIRLDLKEILEEEGYEVVGETGRGDEAVALVKELSPDLAILDIKMPGLDGLAAAREISGERRAAVVILTAFSQRDLIEQARDAGRGRLPREAVPEARPAAGHRGRARSLRGEQGSPSRGRQPRGAAGDAQGRRPAKGMLMDRYGMSENDAFAFIQKTAMRERVTMKMVAQRIIDGELHP